MYELQPCDRFETFHPECKGLECPYMQYAYSRNKREFTEVEQHRILKICAHEITSQAVFGSNDEGSDVFDCGFAASASEKSAKTLIRSMG